MNPLTLFIYCFVIFSIIGLVIWLIVPKKDK